MDTSGKPPSWVVTGLLQGFGGPDRAARSLWLGEMAERGELTLEEAARQLDVSKMTVLRLISVGTITGTQVCKGAPWAIPETQITGLDGANPPAGRPRTYDQNQKVMDFQ